MVLIVGETYRRTRFLDAWLNPWADRQGNGYQLIQGLIAIGSGGWLGTGLGTSRAKWDFLPNAHSDFIYAVIGEELGLLGALAAARAYDLDIVDGVFNVLSDEAGFRSECEQGRDCGFDGKTLIHPNQVPVANEVFAPPAAEVERSRAVIAAFERPENRSKGAIAIDGRMVERLHAEIARRTIALADAIAAQG